MPFLPPNQQRQSTEGTCLPVRQPKNVDRRVESKEYGHEGCSKQREVETDCITSSSVTKPDDEKQENRHCKY